MAFTNCDKCGYRYFTDQEHKCPPMYEVFEFPDISRKGYIYAHSPEEAAEKCAEGINNYHAQGPKELTICVRRPGEDGLRCFNVEFEICIDYMAQEVK